MACAFEMKLALAHEWVGVELPGYRPYRPYHTYGRWPWDQLPPINRVLQRGFELAAARAGRKRLVHRKRLARGLRACARVALRAEHRVRRPPGVRILPGF